MPNSDPLYRPGEMRAPLEPGEVVRYSFGLAQGKKGWFGYDQLPGVTYNCHLTSSRIVLESNVLNTQGFFLLKALVTGMSLAAGAYGIKHTKYGAQFAKANINEGQNAANAVRDQSLELPYDVIDRVEKSFPCWLRLVLKNPPPKFDPHSLVFLPFPIAGRTYFKTGLSAAADVQGILNEVLRDHPRDAEIV